MATSLGSDTATSWSRLVAGESGIRRITYFDASQYSCKVAAEARSLEPDAEAGEPTPNYRRGTKLFLRVAREAHDDARLDCCPVPRTRVGVAAGASVNYVNMNLMRYYFRFRHGSPATIDLDRFARDAEQPAAMFFKRQGDLIGSATAKRLGLAGPNFVIDTACAASSYAVAEAFRLVQTGRADVMIAGGACAIVSPIAILAFAVLGALSTNPDPEHASCPFDRRRNGFVMGEGAGAVVLERYDLAVERGAKIYGELVGCGMTMNAHTLTDPSPDGAAEAQAMTLALAEAKLTTGDIDYIAAHGTSTPKNDASESAAIRRVFREDAGRVMVSSNKGQIGHTISAAGVCNLICATKAIHDGIVPPTAHYTEPDPLCDLDYVPNVARKARVGAALVNAFAFGGQNIVLAVKAA